MAVIYDHCRVCNDPNKTERDLVPYQNLCYDCRAAQERHLYHTNEHVRKRAIEYMKVYHRAHYKHRRVYTITGKLRWCPGPCRRFHDEGGFSKGEKLCRCCYSLEQRKGRERRGQARDNAQSEKAMYRIYTTIKSGA